MDLTLNNLQCLICHKTKPNYCYLLEIGIVTLNYINVWIGFFVYGISTFMGYLMPKSFF